MINQSAQDYYSGGSIMPGRSFNSNTYRFGYNAGSEKDDEITGQTGSHLSFEYRIYDSRIGRFLSIDPLTSIYPYWTPYQFAGLTPIWAMELEGLEPYLPYQEAKQMEEDGRKIAFQGFSKSVALNLMKDGKYDVFYRNVSQDSPESWKNYVAYYKPKLTNKPDQTPATEREKTSNITAGLIIGGANGKDLFGENKNLMEDVISKMLLILLMMNLMLLTRLH